MKKSDLKLLIKECIKEVIFDEGVLSGIITEVASGVNNINTSPLAQQASRTLEDAAQQSAKAYEMMEGQRKEVMDAIASNNYEEIRSKFSNPEFFAGTRPLKENKGHSALSSVSPSDSGLDISKIPGFGQWGAVARNNRK
jgi:hypothetical protein